MLLEPGDDLRELAEDAVRRGADVLGMAGGDGSQALVASVAAQAGLDYVCVPAGTRNHFALDLGRTVPTWWGRWTPTTTDCTATSTWPT